MTSSAHSTLGTAFSGPPGQTLVQALFEGILTSETRCLTCETVPSIPSYRGNTTDCRQGFLAR